jgi:molecular chaperone DnaJ
MDFYQLLGLSRSASADEVERAYRRLARRHHPGINPGDRVAEEMFRQIQEAYEVLGDAARRGEYDRGVRDVPVSGIVATVAFEGFDFSAQAEGASAATFSELFADVFHEAARRATTQDAGGALEATLVLSFEHAMRGGHFPLSIVRQARCEACGGDGRLSRRPVACAACGGQGMRRWARGHMLFTTSCESCGGTGQIASQACRTCSGAGTHARSEVVTVSVPPGIEDGARVVVPGRGHAGLREDGACGDLYVRIEVTPHAIFRRDGRDLHLALPVAVHEAALGAEVDVPTLDGSVRLRIPSGTSAGQRLRIRGHGVFAALGPDRADAGDLIAEVVLVLPPVADERSRELLREFGRRNPVDVRRHLFERS